MSEVEKYRPTMTVEVAHSWAVDAQKELDQLRQLCKELAETLHAMDGWFDASDRFDDEIGPLCENAAIALAKYREMVKP